MTTTAQLIVGLVFLAIVGLIELLIGDSHKDRPEL
jgi:hypothetical protein